MSRHESTDRRYSRYRSNRPLKSYEKFILGEIPSRAKHPQDREFSEAIVAMFCQLSAVSSECIYAEISDILVGKQLRENLEGLSPSDFNSLANLFCDPQFIILLSLVQSRTNNTTELSNLAKNIYASYNLSIDEEQDVFETLARAHGQVWASFIGLKDNCLLDFLIEIESQRNPRSIRLKNLRSVKLTIEANTPVEGEFIGDQFVNHLKLAPSSYPLKEGIHDFSDLPLSQRILDTYLTRQVNDFSLKVSAISIYITEQHSAYVKKHGRSFNYFTFIYDVFFNTDNLKKGFLTTALVENYETWLTQFFATFLPMLNDLTSTTSLSELVTDLDDSFDESDEELDEAVKKFVTKDSGILNSVKDALLKMPLKLTGITVDTNDTQACSKALAKIFSKPLKQIKNGQKRDHVRNHFLRPLLTPSRKEGGRRAHVSLLVFSNLLDQRSSPRREKSTPVLTQSSSQPFAINNREPKKSPLTRKQLLDRLRERFNPSKRKARVATATRNPHDVAATRVIRYLGGIAFSVPVSNSRPLAVAPTAITDDDDTPFSFSL